MQPTTFLYFAFGDNLNNHTMSNFSMLTIKKLAPVNSRFVIYTDRPEFYKWSSSFVETRNLDQSRLKEWKGVHNFVWRVKIMAMLDSAEKDTGHLVYLDSDTMALNDLSGLIQELENNMSYMHLKESLLCEDKAPNKKQMWEQTKNKTFGGLLVDNQSAIWNAGVIAISEKNKVRLLKQALASTDEMCEQKVNQWLIEQLSISQSLASTKNLREASFYFAHYWGNKEEWIQNIEIFFAKTFQQMLSVEEVLSSINLEAWKAIPIIRYKRSMGKKLLRFAKKYFDDSVTMLPPKV